MQAEDERPAQKPRASGRTAETVERDAERKRRLAAALRQNLRRRKGPRDDEPAGDGS